MNLLTIDDIDRELASRATEVATMTATLMELDNHPGLEHVRCLPPAGVTAQRWAVIEKSLGRLWEDLGQMASVLASAQTVRARRAKPTDTDRAELTGLLCECRLDLADRMHADYPAAVEFFDAVDEIDSLVAGQLAPWQKRLDEADLPSPDELADLLAVSATDPLSLTRRDVEDRIRVIADGIERRSADLAELAALRANWSDALAATAGQLDALRDAIRDAAHTRARAEQSVAGGPLPVHEDAEPGLREQLAAITARSSTAPDPVALRSLRQLIAAALQGVRDGGELAQGLLDRRRELKGRLTVYQAKAARLGLGEDSELLASSGIATGLLSRRPCDLRAVTRAIADFQQMILEKQGKAR